MKARASPGHTHHGGAITHAMLRDWPLPPLDPELGKESRGTALVVGGSREVPGAVMLAAIGALRAGAGKLQVATVKSVALSIGVLVPEARVVGLRETKRGEIATGAARTLRKEIAGTDALLLGPGVTDGTALQELLEEYLADDKHASAVVDAGALDVLGEARLPKARRASTVRVVATPHAGEMAKLCGIDKREVMKAPEEVALGAARELGIVIALKGAKTYVASPDGELLCNSGGNLGLGTSGSGDTLSGVIAGLLARGATPMQAAAWGVYLHAKAGEVLAKKMGTLGFLARELLGEIPPLVRELTGA